MRVAVLPGDGIGPEIIAQATKVLHRLNLGLEMQQAPVGGAGYESAGDPLPAATLKIAKDADAILFGAVGDPRYDSLPRASSAAEGSMPIEPVSIDASSDRMSPNRLPVTMTSNCFGLRTSCIAQLSTYMCESSTSR